MSIGGVLGEAWGLYTKFFARFFVIALIVFAVVNAIYAFVDLIAGGSDASGASVAIVGIAGLVAGIVGTFWLQGAFVTAVQDVRDGRFDASTGEVFSAVTPVLGTLVIAGLLAGLGIGVGLIFLVVPGLILLTWWAVIAPVIVIEKTGVGGSFGRSRELVRGHAWTVFGIVIVTGLLTGIASGILRAVFVFLPRFFEIFLGGTVASAVVAPFGAIALTLTYFKLREVKEAGAATPTAELST